MTNLKKYLITLLCSFMMINNRNITVEIFGQLMRPITELDQGVVLDWIYYIIELAGVFLFWYSVVRLLMIAYSMKDTKGKL